MPHPPRLRPRWRAPALLALALWACDPDGVSVPEGEPDAAADLDPSCPYATPPLAICEPPVIAEAACAVRAEGHPDALHFDAAGQAIARFGDDGLEWAATIGDQGQRVGQAVSGGCVTARADALDAEHGQLRRARNRDGALCYVRTTHYGEERHLWFDHGCDCRDVEVELDCDYGPYGPVRCADRNRDGTIGARTWLHDDAGRIIQETWDRTGDGDLDWLVVTTYDASGRRIHERIECPGCTGARVISTTWTHEVDPRRTTERRDRFDDGEVDAVRRTTYDEMDRVVRIEVGDAQALRLTEETTWTTDGGYRRVEYRHGEVERIDELIIDGPRTTWISTVGDERVTSHTLVDHMGLEIEHGSDRYQDAYRRRMIRDGRGRVVETRTRTTDDGRTREGSTRYVWSGPCPTAPTAYRGVMHDTLRPVDGDRVDR